MVMVVRWVITVTDAKLARPEGVVRKARRSLSERLRVVDVPLLSWAVNLSEQGVAFDLWFLFVVETVNGVVSNRT
jgi:hypothetical protein